MKKSMIPAIALMATVMGGGALTAHGFAGPLEGCGGPQMERKMNPEKHLARMARELKLTDAQKEQVRTILAGEKGRTAPVRQKLAENRKQMMAAADGETFDEAAVRSLAANQAQLMTELMVSRARVHNQIQSILTPEQRELAKKLRSERQGKGRKGRGR